MSQRNMHLLVFCGTRKAIERFDMQPDWFILVPQYPQEQRAQTIKDFCEMPGGKMAVLGPSFAIGWRAPADTAVLFDPSWKYGPDSAESIQAVARVGINLGWND